MRKEMYPAIFSSDGQGGYTVIFPDLLGCVTEGNTLTEAVEMAEDALGLYLYSLSEDGEAFPQPTNPVDIETEKGEFIDLVKWDEEEYLRKTDNRAVKKTLTIPSWLNHKAEEKQLNFSQILQRALKQELDLI
ncbi:MAG: type II toxin-antitoxin system HicB family antitoxin [Veillonella sp.]|uniref:type II toxin-antitoxin system HicB family antitoxin n=1 Tax=Veillonella sp. TaxID=1926307 RepID=UPI0025EEFDC3|nr:type II toxin-antitoxin system HicB family antitoxin [Veillonella sp.]MBE6079715.1 type II toxin-antitoxin system HicB family antitoxin [Veillonella sp.]